MSVSCLSYLSCSLCQAQVCPTQGHYICPKCGIDGLLDVHYDYQQAKTHFLGLRHQSNPRGIGRYHPLLPIGKADSLPPIQVGGTPLTHSPRLSKEFGAANLFFKEDNRNPTASFKDRASAIVVAVGQDKGCEIITAASTGNAASSLAGLCASVGIKTVIFVPKSAPEAKVTQLLIYGAQVMLVDGSYDDAFELSIEATRQFGWLNRNTGYNPYCLEGKKTCAFEIWEDLGYQAPDAVLVSVGDGCIIGGIGKGFLDLYKMGLISKLPRLYAVQAEGSSVLAKAYRSGSLVAEPSATTFADSICVGLPRVASQSLGRVRESGGDFIVVCDDSIRRAQVHLAQNSGIFAEPAGAAPVAGLKVAIDSGMISRSETVVAVITGHGLKDIRGALSSIEAKPATVSKDPALLKETLTQMGLKPCCHFKKEAISSDV